MPGVQMPHCGPLSSRNFCCSGCSSFALRHAFDGLDLGAVGLDREHQAGAHHGAVDHHGAGAAVAGGAAFLGAGEHQFVAQHVEQRLLRLAQITRTRRR